MDKIDQSLIININSKKDHKNMLNVYNIRIINGLIKV